MAVKLPPIFDASASVRKALDTIARTLIPYSRGAVYPTSPREGDHFYRTDLHKEYCYDGTVWQMLW